MNLREKSQIKLKTQITNCYKQIQHTTLVWLVSLYYKGFILHKRGGHCNMRYRQSTCKNHMINKFTYHIKIHINEDILTEIRYSFFTVKFICQWASLFHFRVSSGTSLLLLLSQVGQDISLPAPPHHQLDPQLPSQNPGIKGKILRFPFVPASLE